MKQNIKISLLEQNTGQIKGLPENPRFIRDEKFEKLKQSLLDDPEMLEHRGQMAFPNGKKFVIIGGNMRMRAIEEIRDMPQAEFDSIVEGKRDSSDFLSWYTAIMMIRDKGEVPCEVLDRDTPVEKLRAFAIKDNIGYGDWDHDMLANEWDQIELESWGLDVPVIDNEDDDDEETTKVISTKLTVECEDPNQLEELYIELQRRGFNCELSK